MKKLIYLLIIGALAYGIIYSYSTYTGALEYSLSPDSEQRVIVDIKKGSSADMIAGALKDRDLISNKFAFKMYLKQRGAASQLKAGRIVFQENFTLEQIVDALVEGRTEEIAVTILEGWTNQQIAEHLESLQITTADDFLSCVATCEFDFDFLPSTYLEGYLYPDTYFVDAATFSNERFIGRMIGVLENKISGEDWKSIKRSDHSFEEIMIMASIVEREEKSNTERPKVAGILWSRFDNGIGLGADATILYALGRTKGGLSYDELQVDSPYNTRKYRALPPTPIANPSISSIRAAIYPNESSYMYYLHDADGQIHYAETLDEHNTNKAKYL